jgi:hypothetical protein
MCMCRPPSPRVSGASCSMSERPKPTRPGGYPTKSYWRERRPLDAAAVDDPTVTMREFPTSDRWIIPARATCPPQSHRYARRRPPSYRLAAIRNARTPHPTPVSRPLRKGDPSATGRDLSNRLLFPCREASSNSGGHDACVPVPTSSISAGSQHRDDALFQ